MDHFNKSVNNAVQFILCVQDACDKHRKCMEHSWLQEYNFFVTEWKQNQIELKKQSEKNFDNNLQKASKCIHSPPEVSEELEELALADSLLKKARNMRMKNQKIINGLIDNKNPSISSADSSAFVTNSTNLKQTSEKNKIFKKISQSKSDFMIHSHKSTVVPRSKSANLSLVPKDNSKSCLKNKTGTSSSSNKSGVSNHRKSSEKTSEVFTAISSKDLEVFKRLHVGVPTSHRLKSEKAASVSDSSKDKNQIQVLPHASSREFLNQIKGQLNSASSNIKFKLWYPFLSSKSEIFLTAVKCNTFVSIKKTCNILYSIQEIMMWIDLLYLMEKEIYPTLITDKRDVNMLRIHSYLLSIFHKNSQRIPILDPNG